MQFIVLLMQSSVVALMTAVSVVKYQKEDLFWLVCTLVAWLCLCFNAYFWGKVAGAKQLRTLMEKKST